MEWAMVQGKPWPLSSGCAANERASCDTWGDSLTENAPSWLVNWAHWAVLKNRQASTVPKNAWAQNGHTAKLGHFQRFRAGVIPASDEKQ